MASRTKKLQVFPWQGGVVTSIDESLLQPGQLVRGDNIIFDFQSSKRRRDGIDYNWDDAVWQPAFRTSSGTTRTLVGRFLNTGIQVGDKVTIEDSSLSSYDAPLSVVLAYNEIQLSETSSAGLVTEGTDTINITSHGLTDSDWIYYRTTGTAIGGLTTNTGYYVVSSSASTFKLALTSGGSAIDLTDDGVGEQIFERASISYTGTTSLAESSTAETDAQWGNKVVGGIDFWYEAAGSKAQYIITVLDNGAIYRTTAGVRTRLTDSGKPYVIPVNGLTEANLEIYNNKVVVAVDGLTNRTKYWDGDITHSVKDLPGYIPLVSVSRESSSFTRTLIFDRVVPLDNGDEILVEGAGANYDGSFVIATGGQTATITYTHTTELTEGTTADVDIQLGEPAPRASVVRAALGRLLLNDKTRRDRLHYCETDNHTAWNGWGDSGALDIGFGDGDPSGLTGIAPPFKGSIFVGKRTKLYRIAGYTPETFIIEQVSSGIGFINHQSIVAIDQDDVLFVSTRGVHSISATASYGDFSAAYISNDIQRTIVEDWTENRKPFIKGAYFPAINSVAFAVSEKSDRNNTIWLFNIPLKSWYRWPGVSAETLISVQDSDMRRAYFGTDFGRLAKTQANSSTDELRDGTLEFVRGEIITGRIFPDARPDTIKGFKRVYLLFRAVGAYEITLSASIDNFSSQASSFQALEPGVALGAFVLGVDSLAGRRVLAPYSVTIDGYGRGIQLRITQVDSNTALELQGFIIEFEGEGDQPETRNGDES